MFHPIGLTAFTSSCPTCWGRSSQDPWAEHVAGGALKGPSWRYSDPWACSSSQPAPTSAQKTKKRETQCYQLRLELGCTVNVKSLINQSSTTAAAVTTAATAVTTATGTATGTRTRTTRCIIRPALQIQLSSKFPAPLWSSIQFLPVMVVNPSQNEPNKMSHFAKFESPIVKHSQTVKLRQEAKKSFQRLSGSMARVASSFGKCLVGRFNPSKKPTPLEQSSAGGIAKQMLEMYKQTISIQNTYT